MIGVEGALKWGAVVRVEARRVGVKVPVRRVPRAWAGVRYGVSIVVRGDEGIGCGEGGQTCTETGVFAENGVELGDQVTGCFHEFLVRGKRHVGGKTLDGGLFLFRGFKEIELRYR